MSSTTEHPPATLRTTTAPSGKAAPERESGGIREGAPRPRGKLVGAPDRTIVALIVQQALILGVGGFGIGVALVAVFKGYFPRRVLMQPGDLLALLGVVVIVCLLGSALSVRAAVKVDPAKALGGG